MKTPLKYTKTTNEQMEKIVHKLELNRRTKKITIPCYDDDEEEYYRLLLREFENMCTWHNLLNGEQITEAYEMFWESLEGSARDMWDEIMEDDEKQGKYIVFRPRRVTCQVLEEHSQAKKYDSQTMDLSNGTHRFLYTVNGGRSEKHREEHENERRNIKRNKEKNNKNPSNGKDDQQSNHDQRTGGDFKNECKIHGGHEWSEYYDNPRGETTSLIDMGREDKAE